MSGIETGTRECPADERGTRGSTGIQSAPFTSLKSRQRASHSEGDYAREARCAGAPRSRPGRGDRHRPVAFPDVQGRLLGKRVTGHYFLDHVERDGIHACAYLLTVDVDMEPLPGFRLASWSSGYQDFAASPISAPSGGSLARKDGAGPVRPDLEEGEPVEPSPRQILAGRSSARAPRACCP